MICSFTDFVWVTAAMLQESVAGELKVTTERLRRLQMEDKLNEDLC